MVFITTYTRPIKLIFIFFLLCCSMKSIGQNDTIPNLIPYEDYDNKLFLSKIVEVDSSSTSELILRFKNWASLQFINLKEVIVSETANQIVLVYSTSLHRAYYYAGVLGKIQLDGKYFVRMVVQFKDGKARAQFYDDGNVAGSLGALYVKSRVYFISSFTSKPAKLNDLHKSKDGFEGPFYDSHCEWQESIIKMSKSFESGLKNNSLNSKKNDFDF